MAKKQTTTQESSTPAAKPAPNKAVAAKAPATDKPAADKPAAEKKAAPAKKVSTEKAAAKPAKAPAAKNKAAKSKVYGEISADQGQYQISKGSVADGPLTLTTERAGLKGRLPAYAGQFVTILGEFGKKKDFVLHSIASHDEIARKAYELSHANPAAVEDNWLKAEHELLGE